MLTLSMTQVTHLYAPDKADEIAAEMTRLDEDGWIYKAVHDPTGRGKSFVEVYDEEGEFVAKL